MQTILLILIALITCMSVLAIIKKPRSIYKNAPSEQNPFEGKRVRFVEDGNEPENADGVRGHLEEVSDAGFVRRTSFYERFIKRCLDLVLSFLGLVILSPLFVILILAVVIDDPGPVFFVQKRVGKNKRYFIVNKFCTVETHKNQPCLAA